MSPIVPDVPDSLGAEILIFVFYICLFGFLYLPLGLPPLSGTLGDTFENCIIKLHRVLVRELNQSSENVKHKNSFSYQLTLIF